MHTETVCGVTLGIYVDQEDSGACFGKANGSIDACRGLADATLLIRHNIGFTQTSLPKVRKIACQWILADGSDGNQKPDCRNC